MESWVQSASYQCVLRFFQSICPNYCACHEKVMPGHMKCCTCHAKSSQQTWRSEAPKCNPSHEISGKCIFADPLQQMPHPCHRFRTCYKTFRFCSLLARSTILCACHAKAHLNLQKWREHVVFCTFWLQNVLRATTACTFSTSGLPKVVRSWCVLYILTSKCASRHNGVHFFDISTSKSGPIMGCFVLFCTFWLRNVLRATTACTFSTSQLGVFCIVLYIWTWKCASRHNGVHFFDISSGQLAPHFSELTFLASGATNHWNKMKPTNPNAHTYVNGTDVKTHGYAVTHNTCL